MTVMRLEYVPLLELQRDIYRLPRNMARFQHYLRIIRNETRDGLVLPPLVAMNPMAREHVPALIDDYLQQNADDVAASAVLEAEAALTHIGGEFKIALVVMDDLKGGWTNRYSSEFALRCSTFSRKVKRKQTGAVWLTAVLWSSESASLTTVRQEILMTVFRVAYRVQNGPPHTIRLMLAQEGVCMSQAGCTDPVLEPDEIEYTRQVIEPFLEAGDMPTAISCLYGDSAARSLGFTQFGLNDRAGLALALHDELRQGRNGPPT